MVRLLTLTDHERRQFAAVFLTIKGVQQVAEERHSGATFSDLFTNAIFRDIVISISATVGLYIIASLIHVRVCPRPTICVLRFD